jgi:hypothetical protein
VGLQELRELRSLRPENAKLKQVVADLWRLTVLLKREGWRINAKRV